MAEKDPLDEIARALARPDTMLLLGAGVSKSSGLPLWKELVVALCDFAQRKGACAANIANAREVLHSGNIAGAIGFLDSFLDLETLKEFLIEDQKFLFARPSGLHRKIFELGVRNLATPNLDQLLEVYSAEAEPDTPIRVVLNDDYEGMEWINDGSSSGFCFKYHGDAEKPKTIDLSSGHYAQIIHGQRNVPAQSTLETLLRSRPVVMIGVGLEDPDLNHLLGRIKVKSNGHIRDIYAISHDQPESKILTWRRDLGLIVASYDTEKDEDGQVDHSNLVALLDDLIGRTSRLRQEAKAREIADMGAQVDQSPNIAAANQRLQGMSDADDGLRRAIVGVVHWLGPVNRTYLYDRVKYLGNGASDTEVDRQVDQLEDARILKRVGDAVFPDDLDFVAAIGGERIEDAARLLEDEA